MADQQADQHADRKKTQKKANLRTLRRLILISIGMFGFGFAMWPLYEIFCDVTGFGGRGVQEVTTEEIQHYDDQREITMRFDATVNSGLNWQFEAIDKAQTVQLGKLTVASYTSINMSDEPVIGHAVFNVAPPEASLYFVKTECFCFTEQLLLVGEQRDMPVTYYISPDLPADIESITLSYTFFKNIPATLAYNKTAKKEINNQPNPNNITTNDTRARGE
ncbi:MAG: cytochrome c oxidase assembly protein [Xanthomonadales bacterium]|nr:cytochrome c oxidase assembly protein [Xanthomonadales bacterium]